MKHSVGTQQGKAQISFALIVVINFIVSSIIITGIVFGIKGYVSDTKATYESITCCRSICSNCIFTLHTFTTVLPWACVVIFFVGICLAIYKTFFLLFRNYSFIRSLPSISIENHPKLKSIANSAQVSHQLMLLDNNELRSAFTLGLLKPKVYLSLGICSYLTEKEILAVILHEIHHKKNKDPLKLFVIQILYALNFFLPVNRYLLHLFSSASEKAADDNAIYFSKEPLELASALVKLCKSNRATKLYPLAISFKGQNIVEDRIRRLLEPQMAPSCFARTSLYSSCLLSLFIAVILCLSLICKFFTPAHPGDCKTKTCHMIKCG
ncbi:MAG: M56 family metallopeptidase [Candidatus Jettenia caeni]|nr:M56 family metallopeptidase [Candidatus Jettenia caeni]